MPRHIYDYEPIPDSAGSIVERMVGSNKRVLELGSGPGAITKLLRKNGCMVYALEVDPAAIELVSSYCEEVIAADLNDPDWVKRVGDSEKFSTVVAADVLEHLYDPWSTLKRIRDLLTDDGCAVISLPHLGHNAVLACLMQGEFDYQPWGLLDRTHIRFFGIKNVQRLFEDAGYKIVDADFVVKDPLDTEFSKQWRRLPEEAKAALARNEFGTVYQVVVKAVPNDSLGDNLDIAALHLPKTPRNKSGKWWIGKRIRSYLVSFLSLDTRQKISEVRRRLGHRL